MENNSVFSDLDWQTIQFKDAIEFMAKKLDIAVELRAQVAAALQETAFYVTGMVRADAIAQVHDSLNTIITAGGSFADFKRDFKAIAEKTGFQPREGVSARAAVVFETNMHSALNAGIMQGMRQTVSTRPYASLLTAGGARTCGNCSMMSGVTMTIQQWDGRGGPPFHHRCRCELRSFSVPQLEKYGLKPFDPDKDTMPLKDKKGQVVRQVSMKDTYSYKDPRTGKVENIPVGISPGFNYAKGLGGTQVVNDTLQAKISSLPAYIQPTVKADFANPPDSSS